MTQRKMITNLHRQLTHFGLNPQDWKIQRVLKKKLLVTHKEDPDFKFAGQICNYPLRWEKLELVVGS